MGIEFGQAGLVIDRDSGHRGSILESGAIYPVRGVPRRTKGLGLPYYSASMRSSVPFGSRTTIAVPDSIRYFSPGLKSRPSGATSRVPLRGGRMPPPRRGTPLTKSIPRETPQEHEVRAADADIRAVAS